MGEDSTKDSHLHGTSSAAKWSSVTFLVVGVESTTAAAGLAWEVITKSQVLSRAQQDLVKKSLCWDWRHKRQVLLRSPIRSCEGRQGS